ncbi:Y-family DNA polymerase [Lacunimicrobium album]
MSRLFGTRNRILCVWFPHWQIQRLASHERALLNRPVVISSYRPGRGDFVFDANVRAGRFGVKTGLPLAEAHSLVLSRHRLAVFPVEPDRNRHALEEVAVSAQAFTPVVSLEEAEHPETLILDLSGTSALWTSEDEQLEAIQQHFEGMGYQTCMALAHSLGAAWGLAHFDREARDYVLCKGRDELRLSRLPVEALRLETSDVSLLRRLGIKTLHQLLKLERSSLKRRLGERVCVRLSQFLGDVQELLVPYRSPERFEREFRCEQALSHQPSIEHIIRSLLEDVLAALSNRQLGLVRLRIELSCEDRRLIPLEIDLGFPTLDKKLLWDLCLLKWEQLQLTSAVMAIHLEATQTQRLFQRQSSLIAEERSRSAGALQPLIAKLSARLGKNAVNRFRITPDPLPESSVQLIPAMEAKDIEIRVKRHLLQRPLRLFQRAEALEVMGLNDVGVPRRLFLNDQCHDVIHAGGPERIESAWWRGPMQRRDYYRVETSQGRRWWIFQRLADRSWFLQGEWA